MFGCIIAGRLVQTNLQQVDVNKYIFELPDAASINHVVVFLLGTIPFEPGYAATVHFLWPNKPWQLLGMVSNDKPSAIFRLRGTVIPDKDKQNFLTSGPNIPEVTMEDETLTSITATLGISLEPVAVVQSQVNMLPSSTPHASMIVPASQAAATKNSNLLMTKILQNLFNFVTSFATNSVQSGMIVGASTQLSEDSYLPLKAFKNWYDKLSQKLTMDPGYLLREDI